MAQNKTNFPGYQSATDILTTYLNSLQTQSAIWNNAWSDVLTGKYAAKDLFRDVAKTYQSQYDTAASVLSYRPNNQRSDLSPTWLNMAVSQAAIPSPLNLSATPSTRPFTASPGDLKGTPLAPFGGGGFHFTMSVSAIDAQTLFVEINGAYNKTGPVPLDTALRDSAAPGTYLGMVSSAKEPSNPPLVIVTLVISP
jgi:hypothetical protein